ncbi:MAG: hypothetical protein U0871_00485 [Gemmataceae bacterium]
MRKLVLASLFAGCLGALVGCGGRSQPEPGYTISKDKSPIVVTLLKGGKPLALNKGETGALALFGAAGGIRYDLVAKGDGVYESPADGLPHGDYTATLFITGGKLPRTFNVAKKLTVDAGQKDHKVEVKVPGL